MASTSNIEQLEQHIQIHAKQLTTKAQDGYDVMLELAFGDHYSDAPILILTDITDLDRIKNKFPMGQFPDPILKRALKLILDKFTFNAYRYLLCKANFNQIIRNDVWLIYEVLQRYDLREQNGLPRRPIVQEPANEKKLMPTATGATDEQQRGATLEDVLNFFHEMVIAGSEASSVADKKATTALITARTKAMATNGTNTVVQSTTQVAPLAIEADLVATYNSEADYSGPSGGGYDRPFSPEDDRQSKRKRRGSH